VVKLPSGLAVVYEVGVVSAETVTGCPLASAWDCARPGPKALAAAVRRARAGCPFAAGAAAAEVSRPAARPGMRMVTEKRLIAVRK